MRTSRLLGVLLATVCCATVAATVPAAAAPPSGRGGGPGSSWVPYRTPPFDLAAGTRCTFGLTGTPVTDRERIRTLASFPDGTPKVQQVTGPLVVRYTNTETSRSVRRNLSGQATVVYAADGSFTETLDHGHFAVGLASTDPGGPGFFVLTGSGFRLSVSATGSRTLSLGSGRVENLCTTLGSASQGRINR